jgi:hypothetical protein
MFHLAPDERRLMPDSLAGLTSILPSWAQERRYYLVTPCFYQRALNLDIPKIPPDNSNSYHRDDDSMPEIDFGPQGRRVGPDLRSTPTVSAGHGMHGG